VASFFQLDSDHTHAPCMIDALQEWIAAECAEFLSK